MEEYGIKLTNKILADADDAVIMADVRKEIRKREKEIQLKRCAVKNPHLTEVVKRGGSWPALWNVALHHGSRHTAGLQHLTRILAHHANGLKPCRMCDECLMRRSLIDHILDARGIELELPVLLSTDKLSTLIMEWDL